MLPYHFYILAAAHLNAVSRLFEKMSLIRRLQLEPVVMADMFRKRGFLEHEDENDRVKEYTGKLSKNWQKVNGLIYYQTTKIIVRCFQYENCIKQIFEIIITDKNGCEGRR